MQDVEEEPSVRTVLAPYDSGHRGLRMGAGPDHLMNNGLHEMLGPAARPYLSFVQVLTEVDPPAEVATAFELDRLVAVQVREALAEGEFPLVLSGNCNTAVGTISGLGTGDLGVVWFDAHADFNTPETTSTGFTDGMGLAVAVGHCWSKMARAVPGFAPVAERNVVLAGVRAVETSEEERLAASEISVVGADRIGPEGSSTFEAALDGLKSRVGRVYVHLDLDVLDPEKAGKANQFAPEGGLSAEDLESALGVVRERFAVAAAGIASYDPAFDADGCVLAVALACARMLTDPADTESV
ncbi:MAG: Arginase [uncultured Rubrobacteraceae bacterium]|uniref:Arginase n=1 Tax=uncultured Rubrobacteraceae bacterium TaxID=349277 RepID=A0A6J4RB35_9ACTN|nr:MAG: Arginase [uncultured Rubrobacteraceae bacterium]